MLQHSVLRPLVGLPLAALVVLGLFSFMQQMVTRDFVAPPASPQKMLTAFTYHPDDVDPAQLRVRSVNTPQPAKQPPPLPRFTGSASEVNLPAPNIQGRVPTELPIGAIEKFALSPVIIDQRDAQPLRPPVPSYPSTLARKGVEGNCEVSFDVDVRGAPYNINAVCSHAGFVRAAERAVSRVEFAPRIERGQAVQRRGVVYPIEFRLDG